MKNRILWIYTRQYKLGIGLAGGIDERRTGSTKKAGGQYWFSVFHGGVKGEGRDGAKVEVATLLPDWWAK